MEPAVCSGVLRDKGVHSRDDPCYSLAMLLNEINNPLMTRAPEKAILPDMYADCLRRCALNVNVETLVVSGGRERRFAQATSRIFMNHLKDNYNCRKSAHLFSSWRDPEELAQANEAYRACITEAQRVLGNSVWA